jgi:hypothetical protein
VTEPDALRRLAEALDDVGMHLTLLALLPWTVHVDHRAERAEFERRASRERAARLLSRIPTQRIPIDVRRSVRR